MTVRVVLLDVEGTTTPVSFVYEKLFPYARRQMRTWLKDHLGNLDVHDALLQLAKENIGDLKDGAPPFSLSEHHQQCTDSAAAYCLWLMDRDRKTTPLKTIQGLIWQEAFERGELKSEIFSDVPASFSEWQRQGRRIAIYSSGSVAAQKLIFEHSPYGSLLPYIEAFFDTRVGPKRDVQSYQRIVSELNASPEEVLFVSDISAELDAASSAGLSVALSIRPGNSVQANPSKYRAVHSFAEL